MRKSLTIRHNLVPVNNRYLIIGGILLFIFALFYIQVPQNFYKKYTLQQTYGKIMEAHRNNDCYGQYEYLLPTERLDQSLDNFVLECQKGKTYSEDIQIHSIEINGDEGLINRTISICYSKDCTGENKLSSTGLTKFFYINGKWYFSNKNSRVLCRRTQPYARPEEFNRALSLIIQRLENSQYRQGTRFEEEDRSYVFYIKKIQNCLNIQYASSEGELNGAEGSFYFDKNSTNDDLKILVSPTYQIKDDLLTATLLRHELQHAVFHATGFDNNITCFQNEANAFGVEVSFYLGALNQEERNSIFNRYYTSPEAKNIIDLSNYALGAEKESYAEALLSYVKNSSFYQKQCSK